MTPYGTEAMHVLRAEKGYIIIGQDTDGTVTPDDAGLAWAIGKNKPDFVGKRSLQRPAMLSADRRQLVGLLHCRPAVSCCEEGAQVMAAGARPCAAVTPARTTRDLFSYHSAALGRSIALGLIAGARARVGQTLYVPQQAGVVPVQLTSPVFYDPSGVRLNA